MVVQGNLLLITDTAANVARLLQIVAVLDVEARPDELRIVPVRFADAVEMAKILNDFFAGRRVRTPTAAPRRPPGGLPGRAARAGRGRPSARRARDGERPAAAHPGRQARPTPWSSRPGGGTSTPSTSSWPSSTWTRRPTSACFVYYVENVKAKELAATLSEIFGKPGLRRRGQPEPPPDLAAGPRGGGVPAGQSPPAPARHGRATGRSGAGRRRGPGQGRRPTSPTTPWSSPPFPGTGRSSRTPSGQLDRTPKQVLIEVLVAEVSPGRREPDGDRVDAPHPAERPINGQTVQRRQRLAGGRGPASPACPAASRTATLGGLAGHRVPAGRRVHFLLFETDRFLGLLNLYANYGQLNVLSSPHILTSENKKAVINVSELGARS